MDAHAATLDATSHPPAGFVHVDLDGLWTLAGAYGFPEGDLFARDAVYATALPRLLDLLGRRRLGATFFLIGRDAAEPAKRPAVRAIVAAGHETANHTWSHTLALERLAEPELEREIAATSDAIAEATGRRPIGVRAPGYGAGPRTLAVCARLGLRYDGSSLPTPWGPALRLAAGRLRRSVMNAPVAGAELQYGGLPANPLDPLAPGLWRAAPGAPELVRLPLAVSPGLRLPLHASIGMQLGIGRVSAGLARLARRGHPVTWLLHGMDLLGAEDLAGRLPARLAGGPGFREPLAAKLDFLERALDVFQSATRPERTADWLDRICPAPEATAA